MRKLLPLLALVVAPVLVAQPVTVPLDPASTLAYTGRHPAHRWTGTSTEVTGRLVFDPANPAQTRITVSVPVESFDSGNAGRDSNMLDEVEVDAYPAVTFEGAAVEAVGWAETAGGYAGTLRVRGDLTFHGQTHPVEFPVAVRVADGRFEATAQFSISLSRFGVRRPRLMFKAIDDAIVLDAYFVATLR